MHRLPSIPHAALTDRLIGIYYDVYNELGHGFLESVYERAMEVALAGEPCEVQRQPSIEVHFRGHAIGTFRADFVIDGVVVLELKAVHQLQQEHEAQLINYLRASSCEVGLLMNFGPRPTFRRVIHRVSGYGGAR